MMIHPLIKLIATEPGLLLAHFYAYGELLVAQLNEGARSLEKRLILMAMAVTAAICSLVFFGVAAIVAAAVPIASMPYPALLIAVPGTLLVVSIACWVMGARQKIAIDLQVLRDQAALDIHMIHASLDEPTP